MEQKTAYHSAWDFRKNLLGENAEVFSQAKMEINFMAGEILINQIFTLQGNEKRAVLILLVHIKI